MQGIINCGLRSTLTRTLSHKTHPHPGPLPEREGLADKDKSIEGLKDKDISIADFEFRIAEYFKCGIRNAECKGRPGDGETEGIKFEVWRLRPPSSGPSGSCRAMRPPPVTRDRQDGRDRGGGPSSFPGSSLPWPARGVRL